MCIRDRDNIDLLFLDIEFGEVKGTDITEQLRQRYSKDMLIVFISAYSSYVSNTFRADAFGFLVKPITQECFYNEFRRCLKWHKDNAGVFIRVRFGEPIEITKSKVVFLEAHKRIIRANMCDGSFIDYYGKISNEANELASSHFIQCHRSTIVNLAYVQGFTLDRELLLNINKTGTNDLIKLAVSAKYRNKVKNAFMNYLASYK